MLASALPKTWGGPSSGAESLKLARAGELRCSNAFSNMSSCPSPEPGWTAMSILAAAAAAANLALSMRVLSGSSPTTSRAFLANAEMSGKLVASRVTGGAPFAVVTTGACGGRWSCGWVSRNVSMDKTRLEMLSSLELAQWSNLTLTVF